MPALHPFRLHLGVAFAQHYVETKKYKQAVEVRNKAEKRRKKWEEKRRAKGKRRDDKRKGKERRGE